jgi:predicted N-acyltransferase
MDKIIESVSKVDKVAWWDTWATEYPFFQYEFLLALEYHGCTGLNTGWQPMHLCQFDGAALRAVMPLYLKQHSWGEYVFDQEWASAYQHHGIAYYPKFVTGAPFMSLITIIEPPIITAIEPMSISGNTQLVSHFLFSCLPMQVYSEKYTSVL